MQTTKMTGTTRFCSNLSASECVYFSPDDVDFIIDAAGELPTVLKGGKKKGAYYNIPCAFDIETTNTYIDGDKFACMYVWMFGINGICVVGRTWEEWEEFQQRLAQRLKLSDKLQLLVYVHNLAFEFQFLSHREEWDRVFALDTHEVISATNKNNIEYRCSYKLTNLSLATVGDGLSKYKVAKKTGDLDYSKTRNNLTTLDPEEIGYCLNDVRVVMALIQERIESDGDIAHIPMTQTGYARRHTRNKCVNSGDKSADWKYRRSISDMKLDVNTYTLLKQAFQGGFTHANAAYSEEALQDITSYDFTSSYPTVLCAEKFPTGSPIKVDMSDPAKVDFFMSGKFCTLFIAEFINISPRRYTENYISRSKCVKIEGEEVDNGRVVSADRLITVITDVDFDIIKAIYKWDNMYISSLYAFRKSYLPKPFIMSILELYKDKTALKGIPEKEELYTYSKQILNSLYGMCVTAIVRPEITFSGQWEKKDGDEHAQIEKYNNTFNRFLYYPWGVWCTAYARRNLFSGIVEFGNDFVYSDTDSVKVLNAEKHSDYIEKYNKSITEKLRAMCDYYDIDYSYIEPETVKGEKKPLGVWDYDGHYKYFKTLGAKRYCWAHDDGEVSITVSGIAKWVALPKMLDDLNVPYKKNDSKRKIMLDNVDEFPKFMEVFTNGLEVPKGYSGRLIHQYIDEPMTADITDYQGNTATMTEWSYIHLEESAYNLTMDDAYIDLIFGLKQEKWS